MSERIYQEWFEQTLHYISRGSEVDIHNFTLLGPIDVPTEFHTLTSILKYFEDQRDTLMILSTKDINSSDIYERILSLEIPQRVVNMRIRFSPRVLRYHERRLAQMNMPSVAVGFGNAISDNAEVILLFAALGYSPQRALADMKERVQDRLKRLK